MSTTAPLQFTTVVIRYGKGDATHLALTTVEQAATLKPVTLGVLNPNCGAGGRTRARYAFLQPEGTEVTCTKCQKG